MMRRTLMLLIIALGALLQQLLPGWPICGGIKPPVVAAIALHYALRTEKREMWLAVLFAAILQDGLDIGSFGPALLAFPAGGLLAYRIRNEIFADGLVSQLILGALLGFVTAFAALLVYSATGQREVSPLPALVRLISSIGLGMATLPLVSRTIIRIEDSLPKRKGYGWQ
jgi:cell shape-determining protein MreD